tara:strand:+ start:1428 stop:3290 length:1863 start_codon:yes stop_codon:yes gene_type:complete
VANPNFQKRLKNIQNKNRIIRKDFNGFRNELFNYARNNFSNQIQDFSEASLGGMFLDFAAIVGESLSFYMEQQFNELDYEMSTNDYNLINHLRKAGVTSGYASSSSVYVDFYIEVPTTINNEGPDSLNPNKDYLPIIKSQTSLTSTEGINFILEEDVNFNEGYDSIEISESDENGIPLFVIIIKKGLCTSGDITQETVTFNENDVENFLSYTLSNQNVNKIIKISDSDFNEYKEVEFLTQDTVYEKIKNGNESFFEVRPAPFRFVTEKEFDSGLTTIRFGNGNGKNIEEGVFTNPEDYLTLPLMGRDYLNKTSLDPKSLISNDSLGISPAGKVVSIVYKHGGGISHNVESNSINQVLELNAIFPNLSEENSISRLVKSTLAVNNIEKAIGGTNSLSLEELRDQIPTALKKQSRIVTHEDLLARIYTMPSDFGKIHKAAIIKNPYTKAAKDLYIICKDNNGNYIPANDAIKINLSKYLNEYRLIGDSLNIIDTPVYNFSIYLKIKISPNFDTRSVNSQVASRIYQDMRFETLQIGQGININEIIALTLSVNGVVTVISNYKTIIRSASSLDTTGKESAFTLNYNRNMFSPRENYVDGIVYPPAGGIFELKYPSVDIEIVNG